MVDCFICVLLLHSSIVLYQVDPIVFYQLSIVLCIYTILLYSSVLYCLLLAWFYVLSFIYLDRITWIAFVYSVFEHYCNLFEYILHYLKVFFIVLTI